MALTKEDALGLVEGGLVLILEAIKAGDPIEEIKWRVQEELRLIRRANHQIRTET